MRRTLAMLPAVVLAGALFAPAVRGDDAEPAHWKRHTIDDTSRGADGARLADADGDGRLDLVTGWEEGGVVRVYLQPERARLRERWPAVTGGRVRSVEDAVLCDLDGDGRVDVVSSCEGNVRSIFFHWAPADPAAYLDESAWCTEALPVARGRMAWMFCVPAQIDGRAGIDLVAGGKGEDAAVGWFEAPSRARDLDGWRWHPMTAAGWVMTIHTADIDADGDTDVLISDRKGGRRGCYWLENPGPERVRDGSWARHPVGALDQEVLFLAAADLDADARNDVAVSAKPHELFFLRRRANAVPAWEEAARISLTGAIGRAKSVAAGDLDLDGRVDLVLACEGADPPRSGVFALMVPPEGIAAGKLRRHDISGPEGIKFDLVELLDLDGDGDLDVITCEERTNLGVVWYENPLR